MKKKITTGLIAVWMMAGLALVAGCAVQKNWVATGGSKADGTIQLSYQYGAFQKPELDENQGLGLAIERCSAWGYSQAEAFGGTVQNCQSSDSYGSCNSWLVTKEYQCID